MPSVGDLVLQTANAPGTATFGLIAPPPGRISFIQGCGAGASRYYYATDFTSSEWGYGTVTAGSPDTLSRDAVIGNSLETTAKINFSGSVTLFNEVPSLRMIYAAADNLTIPMGSRRLTGVSAGTALDDAPQLSQIGWQRIGSDVVPAAGTGVVVFSLDTSKYLKFRLEWVSASGTTPAPPFCRFSQDGGSTYKSGATDYSYGGSLQSGSTISGIVANTTLMPLHIGTPGTGSSNTGWLDIDPNNLMMTAHSATWNSSGSTVWDTACTVALTLPPTNVQFAFPGTTIAAARLRLLGWGF
jgi:hypothetical protein